MFVYEKKLQYPVKIKNTNPKLAALIISQYGGPDGELGASLRYLSQRYSMPYPELKGLLTDIGTEEALWASILPDIFPVRPVHTSTWRAANSAPPLPCHPDTRSSAGADDRKRHRPPCVR